MLLKSTSLSKKGYGNAFVSKSSRLKSVVRNDLITGPGQYDVKLVDEIYSAKKASCLFSNTGTRMPYEDPLRNGPRPGPGEYKVQANLIPKYIREKKSSTFASKSERDSFLNNKLNLHPTCK